MSFIYVLLLTIPEIHLILLLLQLIKMAEGGMLPWKLDNNKVITPALDDYGKPLPNPPVGHVWTFIKDEKKWELKPTEDSAASGSGDGAKVYSEPTKDPLILDHLVLPSDTLNGICLRYNVSAVEIRRLNNFSGSQIQFMKTLRIPVGPNALQKDIQPDHSRILVQQFRNATGEGTIETQFYLEEAENDLQKALDLWKADNEASSSASTGTSSGTGAEGHEKHFAKMLAPDRVIRSESDTGTAVSASASASDVAGTSASVSGVVKVKTATPGMQSFDVEIEVEGTETETSASASASSKPAASK